MAALSIKNIPTGPGDSINMDATYANGASRYVIGGVSPNAFAMFGSTGVPGAYQSVGIGISADGIFAPGGSIQKTNAWGFRGAFNHNWTPQWATSVFGSYSRMEYGGAGKALYCNNFFPGAIAGNFSCNPDFSIWQVGTRTAWTPVKNLTFSTEIMYTALDQNMSGVVSPASTIPTKPIATYEFKDQGTFTGLVRAQRTF